MNFTNQSDQQAGNGTPPTHWAKVCKKVSGKKVWQKIGAAWAEHDPGKGGLVVNVRLYGTQIIEGGFSLYPNSNRTD